MEGVKLKSNGRPESDSDSESINVLALNFEIRLKELFQRYPHSPSNERIEVCFQLFGEFDNMDQLRQAFTFRVLLTDH